MQGIVLREDTLRLVRHITTQCVKERRRTARGFHILAASSRRSHVATSVCGKKSIYSFEYTYISHMPGKKPVRYFKRSFRSSSPLRADYYELLGISRNASKDEIKKAFHQVNIHSFFLLTFLVILSSTQFK
jgi:hypothetical protein